MSIRICLLWALMSAVTHICHAETVADETPLLESMEAYATEVEYLKAAEEFVEQPTADPRKARVAFDLIIAATLAGDNARKHRMQAYLLAEQRDSAFGSYLVQSLESDDFQTIVSTLVSQRRRYSHGAVVTRLQGVIDVGLSRLGQQALNQTAAEIGALVGSFADDDELNRKCLGWFADNGKPFGELLMLECDANLSTIDKTQAVTALCDQSAARLLLDHLVASCTDLERELPVVVEAELIGLACEHSLKEADVLFARLPEWKNDPRLTFLHGRMNLALSNDDEAIHDFVLLQQQHADSPWAEIAADYESGVRNMEDNVGQLIEVVQDFVQTLLADDACLEVTVQLTPKFRGYLAFARASLFTDAAIWVEDDLVFAVRREGRSLVMFDASDGPFLSQWRLPYGMGLSLGLEPTVVNVHEHENGEINYEFGSKSQQGAGISSTPPTTEQQLRRFTDRAFFRRFVMQFVRAGTYVIVEPTEKGGNSIRIGRCSSIEPDVGNLSLTISEQGAVEKFEVGQVVGQCVRYGKQGDFEFESPSWPSLPTQVKTSSPVMDIWMAVMKHLAGRQLPLQTAF